MVTTPPNNTGKPSKNQSQNRTTAHDNLVWMIVLALSETGLCRVWPSPTGAAYRNNRLIRYGLKGSADITGILIGGRRLEIEVKTGNAVQAENQIRFAKMIQKYGGYYHVARSVEDAVAFVKLVATVAP